MPVFAALIKLVRNWNQVSCAQIIFIVENSAYDTRLTLLMKVASSPMADTGPEIDPDAWKEFVEMYSPMVMAWCREMGLAESDASDALQEVLIKLLKVMQNFRYDPSRGNFRSWLKTVTSNLVRDLKRAEKPGDYGSGDSRIQQYLAQIKDSAAFNNLSRLLELQYQEELLELASKRIQQRVDPKNWQAYCLYAVDQKKAVDVAQQLEIPVAEVYVAKSRITRMIRDEIAKMDNQG